MKNIFKSTLLLFSSVCLFAACSDDNDSNPTLLQPATFVLNETPYASSAIDLATSTGIPFTWNQPNYGFPIVTQYQFQILPSLTELSDFSNRSFIAIDDVFTTANGVLNTKKVASAINERMGWTELTEDQLDQVPEVINTYVRIAAVTVGTDTIYSNIVSVKLVPTLVVAPSFEEFIYMMGNFNGWSDPVALRSAALDGLYTCFHYLDGGFKFRPNENNWDDDWGQNPAGPYGTLVVDGEEDCNDAGKSFPEQAQPAGFYKIDVDLTTMQWSIQAITSISIIGAFNGWADDVELTYNVADGCWEGTATLEGEFKFRANHDWAINWGGTADSLTQDGSNLSLDAGTYNFKLFISYEGDSHVEISQ